MNNSKALETTQDVLAQPSSRWFAEFGDAVPGEGSGFDCRWIAGEGRAQRLYLRNEPGCASPLFAERSGCGVVFDGVLLNRKELQSDLGEFTAPAVSHDAEIILAAYQRWGDDFLKRLRGPFALIIWDSGREVLLCLRDPLGSHPLFYADGPRNGLLLSASIDVLLGHSAVSNELNRAALADNLLDRYPRLQETFHEAVSRVPPGHVLRVTRQGRSASRYWDPAPNREVDWLSADEVERFDELLDRAVSRCLSFGPTGIFLSGGLDSASVAAVAVERSKAEGLPKPLALSLIFPDPKENEEIVQRGVANQLGLSHFLKPFFEATGSNGLIPQSLKLSETLPAPLLNTWIPAYYDLAREGSRRGCQSIITGGGGDEWLTVSPFLAADLMRDFDVRGVYRLWQSLRRSLNRSSLALAWTVGWTFGVKLHALPPAHGFVKQVAPWALKLRHRLMREPPLWVPPKWWAPDAALRRDLEQRKEEADENRRQASSSYYFREVRSALDHPIVSWELEEMFEVYQRAGVRVLQPFWDADLVDMLYRTPPLMLMHDGRSKGLVRSSMARRFPRLGFERQRKVEATSFYASLIYKDASDIWKKMGGAQTLASLGVIDEGNLRPALGKFMAKEHEGRNAHRVWTVLNTETWARRHVS